MVSVINKPQIIRFEVVSDNGSSFVTCELGIKVIKKQVESLQRLVRFSAMLSETGELQDIEVVTSKD
jgi:hypothetical protein